MRRRYNNRGQAVAELALFGSLVLMVFGTLLSYIQRENDQQYVQMEAFRRALERGCTFQGNESEGAGASVQYTVIETRRQSDVSGSFRKGSPQAFSASSSVFWAIPKAGSQPTSMTYYKINADEKSLNYRDYIPQSEEENLEFRFEDSNTTSESRFREVSTKHETPQGITTVRSSELGDTITTTIPYTIRKKDDDYNPDNDVIVESGMLWDISQGAYRDADGQYKYSEAAVGNVVRREREWQTDF